MRRRLTTIHVRPSLLPSEATPRQVLTVSELTTMVRASLETDFPEVWLEGEISNFRAPGSGHLYCTLKDQTSQIRTVIFRSTALRVRFGLEDGLHVIVRGRLSVYEPRGEYQIILEHLEPKGRGALQLAFEQLKERLAVEGLFDQERKKPLPVFPRTVGIVTSLTGAAIQDMLTILHRRCPILRIVIIPVQVQGSGSAEQIASGIQALSRLGDIDVVIVGRGGGSLEDLWSFNEEVVVRAIASSPIPVVSAVGHDTDVTLADFAADVRAPTPSAAAEIVVPVLHDIVERLGEVTGRCQQAMRARCGDEQQRLNLALTQMGTMRFRVLEEAQRVDEITAVIQELVRKQLKQAGHATQDVVQALMAHSPLLRVRHDLAVVPQLRSRLISAIQHGVTRNVQQLRALLGRVNSLSPLAILDRGYSILETIPTQQSIRDVEQVSVGDAIVARLARGQLRCTVTEVIAGASGLKAKTDSL